MSRDPIDFLRDIEEMIASVRESPRSWPWIFSLRSPRCMRWQLWIENSKFKICDARDACDATQN